MQDVHQDAHHAQTRNIQSLSPECQNGNVSIQSPSEGMQGCQICIFTCKAERNARVPVALSQGCSHPNSTNSEFRCLGLEFREGFKARFGV